MLKPLFKRFDLRSAGGQPTIDVVEHALVEAAIIFAFVTFIAILDPSLERTFAGEWSGL